MCPARERTPVLFVESDDSAHNRVLVHGLHRCSASMTVSAFLKTCTVGPNTVVLTDRLDLFDPHTTPPTCEINAPG